jgi:hypothetical protein
MSLEPFFSASPTSLKPFFSLSPLTPGQYTYDPANPSKPHCIAYFVSYGGRLDLSGTANLEGQYNANQVLLGWDPVPETEQTLTNLADDIYRHCAIFLVFKGTNVSTNNQYLLIFRLARALGSSHPIAQFFVGSSFVRAEGLTQSPHDDIAILLDAPEDNMYVYAVVRLAAAGNSVFESFFFKGVDCYLL